MSTTQANNKTTGAAAEARLKITQALQAEHCGSLNREYIYRVRFADNVFGFGGKDYFFSSLTAIFRIFSPEQIGCGIGRLWNLRISAGGIYRSAQCTVTRELLYRRRADKKPTSPDNEAE